MRTIKTQDFAHMRNLRVGQIVGSKSPGRVHHSEATNDDNPSVGNIIVLVAWSTDAHFNQKHPAVLICAHTESSL